ncbi:hypothetical protein EES43_19040 [Streptomyces sp. ADI96-02]|nr:hypothetical protein EES43_19040 [Streptomyces sp. ADI96-02]
MRRTHSSFEGFAEGRTGLIPLGDGGISGEAVGAWGPGTAGRPPTGAASPRP